MTKKSQVSTRIAFIATIGGLVLGATALVFIPEFRQLLIDFALVGWSCFFLLVLSFPLVMSWSTRRSSTKSQEAEDAESAARTAEEVAERARTEAESAKRKAEKAEKEAERAASESRQLIQSIERSKNSRAKDVKLLQDRVRDWDFSDSKFLHLKNADHEAFFEDFYEELATVAKQWDGDPRELASTDLRGVWERCKNAANAYVELLGDLVRKPGRNDQFRYVPYELRHKNPERYYEMYRRLNEGQQELVDALNRVHRAIHAA